MSKVVIDASGFEALSHFMQSYDKQTMIESIERIIRINTVTGVVREYELETEMSVLYEVKDLVSQLMINK